MNCFLPDYCCTNPCYPLCNPCFNPPGYNPCLPCINPCFPCWPCRPCPCPPAEPLKIPQCFPDLPQKKVKKKKPKKPKPPPPEDHDVSDEEVQVINPCKCCRRCLCMGPKPDQPCRKGPCVCCKLCPCNACRPKPPPPPPPPCSCNPPNPPCTCGKKIGDGDVCPDSCEAVPKQPQFVRCETCGHRKKVSSTNEHSAKPIVETGTSPMSTFNLDFPTDGLRSGPVDHACCRSADILKNKPKPTIMNSCSGCGKPKKKVCQPECPPRLCPGCKALGL